MGNNREILFWLAGAALLTLLLWLLQGILLPFVAGMAIAYFLDPVADWLEGLGLSRKLAVGMIVLFFTLLSITAAFVVIPLLIAQGLELVEKAPHYLSLLRDWWQQLSQGRFESLAGPDARSLGEALKTAMGPASDVLGKVWGQGMALLGLISLLLITPVVSIYLLLDWGRMVASIDELLPRRHAPRIRRIVRDIDDTLAGFVRGQGTVCLLLGLFYAVGLSLVGLQFGLLIGLAAGLISFIPWLGAIIGGGAAGLLALFQFWPNYQAIALVLGVFALGQFLEGNFLTPKLIGNRVKLHPVWVMFALFAFGYVFGFVGVLAAVPMAATLGVLTRHALEQYRHSELYMDRKNSHQG